MIKDKLDDIYKTNRYIFCDIDFELYPEKDSFRIYENDKVIFEDKINNYNNVKDSIKDLLEQNQIKEELRRTSKDLKSSLTVCFYLGEQKEKVEGPISAKIKLV